MWSGTSVCYVSYFCEAVRKFRRSFYSNDKLLLVRAKSQWKIQPRRWGHQFLRKRLYVTRRQHGAITELLPEWDLVSVRMFFYLKLLDVSTIDLPPSVKLLLGGDMCCLSELSYRRVKESRRGNITTRMRRPATNFSKKETWLASLHASMLTGYLISISRCQNCFRSTEVAFALVTKIICLSALLIGRARRIWSWQDRQGKGSNMSTVKMIPYQ